MLLAPRDEHEGQGDVDQADYGEHTQPRPDLFPVPGESLLAPQDHQQSQGAEEGAETDQDERADLGDGDLDP